MSDVTIEMNSTDSAARSVIPPPRWAVWAAHAAPLATLPSGLWRVAMALGIPVGYSDEVLRSEYHIPGWGMAYVIGLALLIECLALLTLGLVRPWGEQLPRRLPFLGGRQVHPRAALIPAVFGTLVLTAIVAVVIVQVLAGVRDDGHLGGTAYTVMVLCYLPAFLWPPLLGAVTYSYHRRHRHLL
jgi:hypothetical protein